MQLYYRIVSYMTPRGVRYFGQAWDAHLGPEHSSPPVTTEDCLSYTEARATLDLRVATHPTCCGRLTYFDGEYVWTEAKGYRSKLDEPAEECDECGEDIPESAESHFNTYHARSCSLHAEV